MITKELIETAIQKQEEMLSGGLGETETHAVAYCALALRDLSRQADERIAAERKMQERMIEAMLDLWLTSETPAWLYDRVRIELRKHYGFDKEVPDE